SSCASNAHTDECSEPLVPSRPVEPAPTHHSPFTIHHSPFTIHHSPFTIHHSPFTIHHSPFTIHHSPFTIHCFALRSSAKHLHRRRTQYFCCSEQPGNRNAGSTGQQSRQPNPRIQRVWKVQYPVGQHVAYCARAERSDQSRQRADQGKFCCLHRSQLARGSSQGAHHGRIELTFIMRAAQGREQHQHPCGDTEHEDELDRLHHLIHHALHLREDRGHVDDQQIWETPHQVVHQHRLLWRQVQTGNEAGGKFFEYSRRSDDEEIHLEGIPCHLAKRHDLRRDTRSGDVIRQLVAQFHADGFCNALLHREHRFASIAAIEPAAGHDGIAGLRPACPRQIELP